MTPYITITGHAAKPVTITRPLAEAPASIHLMRECGYRVTARVAPDRNFDCSDESWNQVFQAEAVLRDLGVLEYTTYNE